MNPHPHVRRYGVRVSRSAVIMLAAVGLAAAPVTSAVAETPPVSGCPAGFQTLSVATLTGIGYRVPGFVDNPANGGNGDGVVCGKPINPTRTAQLCGTPCGVPVLYLFEDNSLTPFH
ncbi:MAG: hypothetical protein QOE24_2806 [Frankiales bacterium]|jgi:hypothetical protein|nr:hypothetical protein [Frankiales bacterium]